MVLIKVEAPKFPDIAKEIERDWAKAVQRALTDVAFGMKRDLRQQIRAAFPNSWKMPNIIGIDVWPQHDVSLGAAASVWVRGKKRSQEIFEGVTQGITISAKGSKWLAIPMPIVPVRRIGQSRRRMTPAQLEEHFRLDLVFIKTKRPGVALLIADRQATARGSFRTRSARSQRTGLGATSVIYYVLTRTVRLPKRTDPDSIRRAWEQRIPGLIDAALAAIPRSR